MTISRLMDLKTEISHVLNDYAQQDYTLPHEIIYSRGFEHPRYKITIEEIDEDFFTDAKGQKWQKVKK